MGFGSENSRLSDFEKRERGENKGGKLGEESEAKRDDGTQERRSEKAKDGFELEMNARGARRGKGRVIESERVSHL